MLVCVSESANGVDQIGDRTLPFSDCFSDRLNNQIALRVDRFTRRGRQIDAGCVFDYPADLLAGSPTLASVTVWKPSIPQANPEVPVVSYSVRVNTIHLLSSTSIQPRETLLKTLSWICKSRK
jgi:hypothetical protein